MGVCIVTWVEFLSKSLTVVTKVGRKGVIVIPKALRELIGIEEKSLVILRVEGDEILIKPLKVLRVEASKEARKVLEEALSEEYWLEEEKAGRIAERR